MKRLQLVINMNVQPVSVSRPGIFSYLQLSNISTAPKIIRAAIFFIGLLISTGLNAQQNAADTGYYKILKDRTAKIVNTLGIDDPAVYSKLQEQLIEQYTRLNNIHDGSKTDITAIKASQLTKDETDQLVKKAEEKKSATLRLLHTQFIAHLKELVNDDQIEKIKDGMTYSVLPKTWTAYLDMLQNLTQEQKDKMYAWLLEARELAMDEGSSDAKHAVFGKYKGKINNYLSAAGYDMKKEGEEWAKRIKEAKENKQTQN